MGQAVVLKRPSREISIGLPKTGNKKTLNQEGELKTYTTRNKKVRLSFNRPSPYPLPRSLLIGFWS